jgi:hypothetical protein
MSALFELVQTEAGLGDHGDGHHNDPERAARFTETMLQLFESHILTTHKIFHVQYLIFFLAGKVILLLSSVIIVIFFGTNFDSKLGHPPPCTD